MRHVVHDPILRAMAGSSAAVNFFGYAFMAVYILFMSRELDLGATAIGLVFATGGVGALIGALVAPRITARLGVGPTMILSQLAFGLWGLLVPAALLFPRADVPLVVAAEFLQWMALIVYSINAVTVRQTITPGHLYGRVNATFRFVTWGVQPLGSLLGGFLGGVIGLPWTLVLGVIGMLLAVIPLARSPLRHGRGDHLVAGTVDPTPEAAQASRRSVPSS